MISHEDIKNLVSEWGLREDIIEKDRDMILIITL